jgi:hypothetical protein
MTQEILSAALAYHAAGFSVFPLAPESKLPIGPWKAFQDAPPTASQLEEWFGKGRNNLAVVLGRVSGNSFCLDFDDLRLARLAFDLERLAQKTFVQATHRGIHVILRVGGEPVKSTSYARRGIPLDVQSEGKYIVVAPSLHPLGIAYRRLSPDLRLATVSMEWLDALVTRLRTRWLHTPRLTVQARFSANGEARPPEDP